MLVLNLRLIKTKERTISISKCENNKNRTPAELSEPKDSNWEQERGWNEQSGKSDLFSPHRVMISMASWLLLTLLALIRPTSPYMSSYCYFNQLCTCKLKSSLGQQNFTESATPLSAIQSLLQAPVDIRDVSCLGVPFAQIPGRWGLETVKCGVNPH